MRRAVANLRHRSLVRTFDLWVYRVSEGAAKEQMLLLFDMDRLKEGMKRWRPLARAARCQRAVRAHLLTRRRCELSSGLACWTPYVKMARAARSIRNQEVAKGWRGWAQVTAAKREERRRVLNAVGE